MAGYPRQYPHNTAIVPALVGNKGHDGDPCSEHSSNQSVFSPLEHSDEVNLEDLSLSTLTHSPTAFSQQMFPGVMDPGSLVYVMKTTGQSQAQILGQANDLVRHSMGSDGQSLMQGKNVQQLMDTELKVNVPPEIKEGESRGVKIKKIKEKGKKHKHSLLEGLPAHGAMFDTTGFRLPQVKDVPTAKQAYSQIPTNDLMSMVPGEMMSLGGMMQGLMSSLGSTKGAGGGGKGGAGGGAGGYKTQENTDVVKNIPDANVKINGTGPFSVTTLEDYNYKQSLIANTTNATANVETSLSYNTGQQSYSSTSTTDYGENNKVKEVTQDVLTQINQNTTVVTSTTEQVTTATTSGGFSIDYLSDEFKKGQAIHRWREKFSNDDTLIPRVNVKTVRALSQKQATEILENAESANTVSNKITSLTEHEETTKIKNFDGSYREYYGEESDITRADIIMSNINEQMRVAFNSLSLLVQGMENGGTGSFPTSNRVHLETYLDHATDLFCQCETIGDMMSVLKRLQHDHTLFGKDKIEKAVIVQNTAWGLANTFIDANGTIETVYSPEQLADQANTLEIMLSSNVSGSITGMASANGWANTFNTEATTAASNYVNNSGTGGGNRAGSSPGGGGQGKGGGGNMFGKHAKTMFDMFKRMGPEHEKDANQLHKKLNQDQEHQDLWKIVEKTMKGGNPIDVNLLKSQ